MNTVVFTLRRLATILAVTALSLTLMAAVTGVLLAFYYQPTAGGAYNSIKTLTNEIPNGALIRSLHNVAGNGIIVVVLLQIVVMFLGERFCRSWLASWLSGIFLTLTAIALSWTAMLLDWSQVGYWRFRIELALLETIPGIGQPLRNLLTGGDAVNTLTVERLYTLHSYVFAIVAVVLAVIHLVGLLWQEWELKQERLEAAVADSNSLPQEVA
jgi:cytochrome b6